MIKIKQIHPRITEIVLNRPEKRNALSHELMQELCDAVEKTPTGIIILRGEGSVFCAGLDLTEIEKKETPAMVAKTLSTLYRSPSIIIAAIHGAALAGGAGIMSACDFVIAAENTHIGYPEVHRGIVPALITGFLTRQVGARHARELLFLGEAIDPHQAALIGLINRVVHQDKLQQAALKLAHDLLRGGPETLSKTKHLIEEMYPGDFEKEIAHALGYHEQVAESAEAKEGVLAFLEKRAPKWQQ